MEPTQGNAEKPPIPPGTPPVTVVQKRSVFRRVRQVLAWLILIFLTLGFATLLFTQTPFFRTIVLNQLVSAIENSTNGTLVVKDIQGNLFQGFVMDDVSLRLKTGTPYDSVTLVHVDHIVAKYSLIRWLRKNEFGITSMVLQRPMIRFVKFVGDTLWNYALLTKPVAVQAAPAPFRQIVELANFRIQNGSLLMRDYNHPVREPNRVGAARAETTETAIDWSDVRMVGIDLDSRLYAHGAAAQSVNVNHLRFLEQRSGFFVQHLEFAGYRDSLQARMDDAKITTGRTSIGFSFEIAPPRIQSGAGIASLEHSAVQLSLKGPIVSTLELKQFLPNALGFLAGSPGIDLDASGEFGALKIKRLFLNFNNRGAITIKGDLKNLHTPDSLAMDLTLNARGISNATLDEYVPGLHIPNLSKFGIINIGTLTYKGEPLDFHTVFDATSTGAGNIAADVTLDLRNHHFDYRAGLRTEHLNLAAFTVRPGFESNLNTQATLAGNGTDWRTLSTVIDLKTTAPSIFDKYHVANLDVAGTMNRGTAVIRHLEAAVEGGPIVTVRSASANLASSSIPFHFDGSIHDLRIAEVLGPATRNPARIDLDANVESSGKNLEEASGTAHVRLFDLRYQGHAMEDVVADVALIDDPAGKDTLSIRSSMADVTIDRHFRLGDLIHAVPNHIAALVTAIRNREFPAEQVHYPLDIACGDSMDFEYAIRVKDLRPLAGFIPQTFLLGEGTIGGTISGCPTGDIDLSMNGDSLGLILRNRTEIDTSLVGQADTVSVRDTTGRASLDKTIAALRTLARADTSRPLRDTSKALALPQFGAGAPRIHVAPAMLRLRMNHLSNDPSKVLDHLDASLDIVADSVVRLGSSLLYHPKLALVYKNQALDFDLATVYNDVMGVRLTGNAHFPAGAFDLSLDSIQATYINTSPAAELREYRVTNEAPAHIRITREGFVSVDTLTLLHPLIRGYDPLKANVFRLSLGGTLQGDSINAWAYSPALNLEQLPVILPPLRQGSKTIAFADAFQGKVRDARLRLNGTLERPDIALTLFSDSMTYGQSDNRITFDSNAIDLRYSNQALRGSLVVHVSGVETAPGVAASLEPDSTSALRAIIDSIPMMIAFKHGPTYSADSAAVVARPLSASINTSHFPIDVATPFIPAFLAMHGSGDIHFGVSGTQSNIQYTGAATVRDGEFLLAGTNMRYLFAGNLDFANNSLRLQDIHIRNISADDPYGEAMVNGYFNFRGFSIATFDLKLRSDRLMVLSNDTRETLKTIYGPMTISTDGQDFHFRNTLEAPWINGTIDILSAKLTLPESNNATPSGSAEGTIVYRTIPKEPAPEETKPDSLSSSSQMRDALACAVNAGSVRMTAIDDTLFPNCLKNIYLNDDGTIRNADSLQAETGGGENLLAPSFVDKLRMNIKVNTPGDVSLVMPFTGVFGIIGAKVDAGLKADGSISVQRDDELGSVEADGTINLTPNSTFKFYQTFNITNGRLTFTRDFGNPELYIVADYIGNHKIPSGGDEQAKIELVITGTKVEPKLNAHIYTNGATGTYEERPEAAGAAYEDAIYFLASNGSFKSDQADPLTQANVLSNISQSIGSTLVTNMLADFVGSTGTEWAVRSASLSLGGAQLGLAYRNIVLHANLNTSTSKESGGADIVLDFPASTIGNAQALKSMMFELQLHQNQTVNTTGLAQQPVFLTKFIWTPWRW